MTNAISILTLSGDRLVTLQFWRKWHRWIGFPASLFLLFASCTGAILAFTEFFGAEEALREATRDLVSPVTLASPPKDWSDPLARAMTTVSARLVNGTSSVLLSSVRLVEM